MNRIHFIQYDESRWMRGAKLLWHWGITCIPFIEVARFLAVQRNADFYAMLMFFIPPLAASLWVLADNGRFNRALVRGAWLLLSVNAVASFFVQIDRLPLQPQFAGALPARLDRALVIYLIGWYSFVLVVCPLWYLRWRMHDTNQTRRSNGWKFALGTLCWAIGVATLAVLAARKLF